MFWWLLLVLSSISPGQWVVLPFFLACMCPPFEGHHHLPDPLTWCLAELFALIRCPFSFLLSLFLLCILFCHSNVTFLEQTWSGPGWVGLVWGFPAPGVVGGSWGESGWYSSIASGNENGSVCAGHLPTSRSFALFFLDAYFSPFSPLCVLFFSL